MTILYLRIDQSGFVNLRHQFRLNSVNSLPLSVSVSVSLSSPTPSVCMSVCLSFCLCLSLFLFIPPPFYCVSTAIRSYHCTLRTPTTEMYTVFPRLLPFTTRGYCFLDVLYLMILLHPCSRHIVARKSTVGVADVFNSERGLTSYV